MTTSDDDAGGLSSEIVLFIGARVVYITNTGLDANLYNGSLGTVVHIVCAIGESPPSLPVCVIVQMENYIGPS